MKGFFSQRDVSMRLHNTIGFYKGRPGLISRSENQRGNKVYYQKLGTNTPQIEVDYTSDHLMTGYIELGNVNTREGSVFLYRNPARSQRWGVTTGSLRYRSYYNPEMPVYLDTLIFSDKFVNMVDNTYPTFAEAFDSSSQVSTAFHRNFSLRKQGALHRLIHQEELVLGTITKEGKITLSHKTDPYHFQFLEKELRTVEGIRCG